MFPFIYLVLTRAAKRWRPYEACPAAISVAQWQQVEHALCFAWADKQALTSCIETLSMCKGCQGGEGCPADPISHRCPIVTPMLAAGCASALNSTTECTVGAVLKEGALTVGPSALTLL